MKMELSSKRKFRKTSYWLTLVDRNEDGGWSLAVDGGADRGNFLTIFYTFTSGAIFVGFWHAFFS
jgi:hypothetical protein